MAAHALLSASSAERWLNCTRAPRLEEALPETTSEYAEEGRLAHEIAELKLRKRYLDKMGPGKYKTAMKKLEGDPRYSPEMQGFTDDYIEQIDLIVMSYQTPPIIAAEQRLDFSSIVPEGFGTGDCILIGEDTLNIVDFKYGKGVPVSAEGNPQMRLYALGALLHYNLLYGDRIKMVKTTIVQPRLNSYTSETLEVGALWAWAETVKARARLAYAGEGEFAPGDWCRFCKIKATCRARVEEAFAVEQYAERPSVELSVGELGDALHKARSLKKYAEDLEEYVESALLSGAEIPGWKLVEGRKTRSFADFDRAIETIQNAGFPKELIYDYKPRTLAQLEKLMSVKKFQETVGDQVVVSPGKPAVVPESDRREPYNSAAIVFSPVTE